MQYQENSKEQNRLQFVFTTLIDGINNTNSNIGFRIKMFYV